MSIISDATGYKHKILDRVFVDQLTQKAQEEIENEQMEMAWGRIKCNILMWFNNIDDDKVYCFLCLYIHKLMQYKFMRFLNS